jgi:hypothetical protein
MENNIVVLHRSINYNNSHNFKANTERICERYKVGVDVLEVGVTNWIIYQTRDFKIVLEGNIDLLRIVEQII